MRNARRSWWGATARLAALALLSPIAGCSVGGGGNGPPLQECFRGRWFADCGGSGVARLGCDDEQCLWFTGGRVAAGYEPSSCPPEDIRCHDGHPYSAEEDGRLPYRTPVCETLVGFGTEPWDRTRHADLVVETEDVTATDEPTVTCSEAPPTDNPCVAERVDLAPTSRDTWSAELTVSALQGWFLWLEVIPLEDGRLAARLCRTGVTDLGTCLRSGLIDCAVSGRVRLEAAPPLEPTATAPHGMLTARFEDGLMVDATW
ncbi:MAG: hypothetical protein ACOCUS_03070 [Polyangiales bacterium]